MPDIRTSSFMSVSHHFCLPLHLWLFSGTMRVFEPGFMTTHPGVDTGDVDMTQISLGQGIRMTTLKKNCSF